MSRGTNRRRRQALAQRAASGNKLYLYKNTVFGAGPAFFPHGAVAEVRGAPTSPEAAIGILM
ncbi:hypothetical protein, partial [Brevibacillus sp. SIMBA_040]|uniref:hypothetical protein n=1 Tax=Brevibacillus sp. SIMBA_040 TaxID=3085781 RepID=UPI00397E4EAB